MSSPLRMTAWLVLCAALALIASCGEGGMVWNEDNHDNNPESRRSDGGAFPDVKMSPKPPPTKEVCNGFDDDQDGQVDEGCSCKLGSKQACFPYGKIAIKGVCKMGSQTCKGATEFTSWGPCTGAVIPRIESCGNGIDEDCDGSDLACPSSTKCETFTFAVNSRPTDIVFIIDQSGSMSQEIAGVKQYMNSFASYISGQKIDYHVIVLASRGTSTYAICIPPPLGGSGCADGPRFKQVNVNIQSWDSLQKLQQNITAIESFMRTSSLRQFVEITDDNSYYVSSSAFDSWIKARSGYNDYVFHSIVSLKSDWCVATVGQVYKDLSAWTKGLQYHICSANWSSLFNQLGKKTADVTKTQYKLAKSPIPGTIKVYYNGVQKNLGTDWTWDSANSQIVLLGTMPGPGTAIKVCYQYKP